MLVFEMNLNVFLVLGLIALSGIIGYMFRSAKIASFKKKVGELEKEMLASHAEILQLQREKIEILQKLEQSSSPVIQLKATAKEEKAAESFADISLRKKLLGSQQPVVSNK